MSEENKCELCQKRAGQKCGNCHITYYCSKEHQKLHWKTHKNSCRPFKVCSNEMMGRHLIATRQIKAGERILQEPPLIWGPSPSSEPICLGCGKSIDANTSRPCSKCGWPVCGELCEKAPGHLPECRYTAQRGDKVAISNFGIPHPTYQCITALRCLYQKQFLPKMWRKLDQLQSHCEERRNTPRYRSEAVGLATLIRRFFKLLNVTEDEIVRICGIILVNGHEVPLADPPFVGIYEITSFFEHSCAANCTKSFTNDGHIVITTARPIEKGENLSICYTDSLWGTANRRQHLHETKFFWCHCPRCIDATEFSTNFSAIKCRNETCPGLLLPSTFSAETVPLAPQWGCDTCQKQISPAYVHDILEKIGRDLMELDKKNVDECKRFLVKFHHYLPDNHYYLTDVKIVLAQLLGQSPSLTDMTATDLELKTKLCQDLVGLMQLLAPAEKRTLGLLHFELHACWAEIGRRAQHTEQARAFLVKSKEILIRSMENLMNEPTELPEGKVYQQAKVNLNEINLILNK